MKSKAKYCILFLFICCTACIVSCTGVGEYQKSTYDDDRKITAEGDSYTYLSRVGTVTADSISLDVKGFYGKETVWKIEAQDDGVLYLKVAAHVSKGKFKMCYINANGEASVIFEGSQDGIVPVAVMAGASRIVCVGNNASGTINAIVEDMPASAMEISPITSD